MKKNKKNHQGEGGGAPKKYEVDIERLQKLASYGNTYEECSAILDVPSEVLRKSYSQIYTKGRESLKQRLRMRQIEAADKGNIVMLIWLGKQYLDQKDKADITSGNESLAGTVIINGKTITNA